MNAWMWVLIAGILEIGWAISLKKTEGFTKWLPMIGYAVCGLGAAFSLSRGMKAGLSMAVAYATWQAIALIGTTVVDSWTTKEMPILRLAGIVLIVVGVASLKLSSPVR